MPLQTRVPFHVKQRYERVAAHRGISLSLLFEEMLDELYPLMHAPQKETALELAP